MSENVVGAAGQFLNMQEKIKSGRAEILNAAARAVCGGRDLAYGSPEQNFDFIADLWSAYIYHAVGNEPLSTQDVGNLMILLKIARSTSNASSFTKNYDREKGCCCSCQNEDKMCDIGNTNGETAAAALEDAKIGESDNDGIDDLSAKSKNELDKIDNVIAWLEERKRDCYIDIAGYAACVGGLEGEG